MVQRLAQRPHIVSGVPGVWPTSEPRSHIRSHSGVQSSGFASKRLLSDLPIACCVFVTLVGGPPREGMAWRKGAEEGLSVTQGKEGASSGSQGAARGAGLVIAGVRVLP